MDKLTLIVLFLVAWMFGRSLERIEERLEEIAQALHVDAGIDADASDFADELAP